MKNYAVLNTSNIVTNLIVADSLEEAQAVSGNTCVEYENHWDTANGWAYNSETNTFADPNLVEETPSES
jgi:hypothetical protein